MRLGLGLVVSFGLVVACTSWMFAPDGSGSVAPSLLVAETTLVIAATSFALSRRRVPELALLLFPVVVLAAELALALTTDGLSPNYTGFFTLVVMYGGLTQERRTVAILAVAQVPVWIVGQEQISKPTMLRLGIVFTVWLIVGDTLAARSARDRADTKDLLDRANTDPLTGLASRSLLSDQIDRELGTDGTSALLVLDLDGFKGVNDMFGHAVGDELLMVVADRIRATFRPGDLCARLGGDEFAVLLTGAGLGVAEGAAARLLDEVAKPILLRRGRMTVTASIGIAAVAGARDAQGVMRDADLAMYEAKKAGRNRVYVFERTMGEQRTARLQLETELRSGLEHHEFELFYQPVVHLQTGAVIGTEALLRWNHPTRGLLTPDQFLLASEEIGVIVALGDWIIEEACRQAVLWQPVDRAKAITMAVNVSAPEMLAADFVARVHDILAASGLPGSLLVLEITERLVVSDAALVRHRIEELRRLGVRIAIDDFGTGYSSLAYLREFPVDLLKIDKSFVHGLGVDTQATALLKSIIAIADALNLGIIVEGVETAAHVEILTQLGCEVAQGFYFARPASAVAVTKMLQPNWVEGPIKVV